MSMADLFLALVHYPVYNRNMKVITSSVTNFDIHDIARTAKTYNIKKYFLIHPQKNQAELIEKVISYWQEEPAKSYNPDRSKALSIVECKETIEEAINEIVALTGKKPITVATDAGTYPNNVGYRKMRETIQEGDAPILLLFGTAFGVDKETMASFDYILEPVYGCCDYNHLCVRSAVAIILDRLAGEAWWQ